MINLRVVATMAVAAAILASPSVGLAQTPEPKAEPPTVAPPPEPGGDIVHSWALGPAGSDDPNQPSDRTTLAYTAAPGSVINDAVTLYNLGNVDLDFTVYATDAVNTDDGTVELLSKDEAPDGVGSWVYVGLDDVTLAAGRQATIPIQIVVPDDARPGDHIGAVLASSRTSGAGDEGVVALDRRTATLIQLRVDGPVAAELAITELESDFDNSVSPLGGSMTVSYMIENRGDVSVSGVSNVTVGGPFGLAEQSLAPLQFRTLLPGESIAVTAEVDDVVATGVVVTSVEIVPDPSGDDIALEPVSSTTRSFAPPLGVLLLMLAVLFGVLAVRAIKRHRRDDDSEVSPPTFEREHQLT